MVHHFIVAAKLWILVLDGVEAVRAGSDDRAMLRGYSSRAIARYMTVVPGAMTGAGIEAVSIQRLDILLGHHLPQVFVADAPCGIACAPFFGSKNSEVDLSSQQDFCYSGCHSLVAPVERTHTADPVEDIGSGVLCHERYT